MSDTWTTIIVLTFATAAIRAVGPVLVGARQLADPVVRVITLLAPALLAALIAVGTFTETDGDLVLDARAAGLARRRRRPGLAPQGDAERGSGGCPGGRARSGARLSPPAAP